MSSDPYAGVVANVPHIAFLSALALAGVLSLSAFSGPSQVESSSDFAAVARPFLDKHCVRCHKDPTAESKFLDLVSPDSVVFSEDGDSDAVGTPDWGWLLEQVEFGDMPPPGEAAPTADERAAFVDWLQSELGDEESAEPLPFPRGGLRRLTAFEYQNAVFDILRVRVDLSRVLPEDAVGHSFDHVASAQSLSEVHFVRYLEAAEIVAERALPIALLDGAARKERHFSDQLNGGRGVSNGRRLWTNGEIETISSLACGGRYRVRAEVYGVQAGPDPCRAQLVVGDAVSEEVFDVSATDEGPQIIEAELYTESVDELTVGVRFVNDYYRRATDERPAEDRDFVVRWIEVEGPLDGGEPTPFMRRFGWDEESELPLLERVGQCAELLWRRPLASRKRPQASDEISDAVLADLLELSSVDESPGHRMRSALVGILASPRFLFFTETGVAQQSPDERQGVDVDFHTWASRVVSFLWRSVPDADLRRWMREGEPANLAEFAKELLADPRADRFAESFVDQWLQLRATEHKRADRGVFPDFDDRLRLSMREETRRVFTASLRERRSLWELIDGTETIVNRRLAEHYGLTADAFGAAVGGEGRLPRGGEWLRASLAGTSRRGLLGHGSILFGTSEATRTSLVSRGRWVLDVLLGSAPPPPPPGADNLAPLGKGAKLLSIRERMEAHRADATCAACHARMDPIGFGLERFDAVGKERASDDLAALDLVGVLPDGRAFDGPVELVAILREEDRFLEALAERLLVFALGRGLERADRAAVQKILASLDPDHPTLEAMILAVVQLDEFTHMVSHGTEPDAGADAGAEQQR